MGYITDNYQDENALEELRRYFEEKIKYLAGEQELTEEQCLKKLKQAYDGYCFHQMGIGVYNPYSLLKAFYDKESGSYWFGTGTPTFLASSQALKH